MGPLKQASRWILAYGNEEAARATVEETPAPSFVGMATSACVTSGRGDSAVMRPATTPCQGRRKR
jgi:hypothetical protein